MSKVFTDVHCFMAACDHKPPYEPCEPSTLSELYKELIKEEYTEFCEAVDANDDAEQLDACFDMIWVIVAYAKTRGWDIDKAWDEGAKSNLYKIDQDTGRVIRRADGKILKPQDWKAPDFAKFTKIPPKPAGIR
jgi:predicted HAD superfamily Cof-like phosphohydrolase